MRVVLCGCFGCLWTCFAEEREDFWVELGAIRGPWRDPLGVLGMILMW